MNLILFGFKSCGKTTLGKSIAKHLGRPFFDTDHLVEKLYYTRTAKSLSYQKIYKVIGEDAFRALESEVLEQLKETDHSIIALGGGLILNPVNAALLAKMGKLVYLKLNKQILKERILRREVPAYLDPLDPEGSFEKMYEERKAKYEKILAFSIDMETKTQGQIVQELSVLIQQWELENG